MNAVASYVPDCYRRAFAQNLLDWLCPEPALPECCRKDKIRAVTVDDLRKTRKPKLITSDQGGVHRPQALLRSGRGAQFLDEQDSASRDRRHIDAFPCCVSRTPPHNVFVAIGFGPGADVLHSSGHRGD